jgi:hypothetical protein
MMGAREPTGHQASVTGRRPRSGGLGAALAILGVLGGLLAPARAGADLTLPAGFAAEVYVSGQGFDTAGERSARGFPSASTLGVDVTGALYLARTGARWRGGEVEDLGPLWRIPPGGARLSPTTEARFLHGPPLPNPQVAAVRGRGEVFVTTYDRDRRLGALYRMVDGRPVLFAGGTPAAGQAPLLRHPEGVAVDAAGDVYVADREQGVVIRLEPTGRVRNPEFLRVSRPRMLLFDESGELWVAGDGSASTPFQDGTGELWRAGRDGAMRRVLQGPLPAGITLSPAGTLFVAQRRTAQLFAVTPTGKRLDFAAGLEGTFVRGLTFVPVTSETRRAGIAGDLLVIVVRRQAWPVNEVVRITGPFDDFVRQRDSTTP